MGELLLTQSRKYYVIQKTFSANRCGYFYIRLTACAPEVGSEAWCKQMKEKPSGDWSSNEAADYAKHCVFK